MARVPVPVALSVAALLWTAAAPPAQSQTPATIADSIQQGYGLSRWGAIPPPGDSVTAPSHNRPMPVWEGILVWPYRVIAFPFRLLADGIGATVRAVDETPFLRQFLAFQPRTFRITPEVSVGGLGGWGFGLAAQHDSLTGPGHQARLRLFASNQRDRKATLGLRFPAGDRGKLTIGIGYRNHANTRYFGVGPGTEQEDESLYREVQTWVGTVYRHALTDELAVAGGLEFTAVRATEPTSTSAPSISQRFPGALPPGFASTSSGFLGGITVEHDDTDGDGRPNRGGRRTVDVGYFRSAAPEWASYWHIRLEAQQFTRLWFPHTVLALRGVLTWMEPDGDQPIPFQRLLHNNDPDLLRGFPDRRWRDRGLLLLTAEYRWPIWVYDRAEGTGLDFYFLSDVGQVFPELSAIRTDDFTFSYGGGIRLLTGSGFAVRVEYARSSEGGLWRLQSHQTFQFVRGLFHGRDAVPPR
jgi:hypothetical protein